MVFVFSGTAYITNLISVPTSMGDLAWVDTPITDFTLFASAGRFCSNWYSITDFTMFATTAFKFKFHFSCSFPFISHDTYIVAFIAVATSLINIFIFVAAFIDHGWFLLSVDFTWVDTSMAHIISAAHCTFHFSWYSHWRLHFIPYSHTSIEDSISFTISITNFISLITFIADLILVAAYTTDSISFHTSVVDVISFHTSSGHIISFATFGPLMPQI